MLELTLVDYCKISVRMKSRLLRQAIADQRSAMLDPITLRLQALGQTPYGQTTTGSSFGLQGQSYQPTSSSPLAGLLGLGLTGLKAASGLGWVSFRKGLTMNLAPTDIA